MTNSHNNTFAPATPPEGPFWSFWEFVAYIDCGDSGGGAFSPELRQAFAKAPFWDEASERETFLRKRRQAMAEVRAMVKAREKVKQGPVIYADIRADVLALNERYEPPTNHLSPRLRQTIAKAEKAFRNRTVRIFEFKDVDGITELREVSPRRPEHMLLEAGAIKMNDLDGFGFIRSFDYLYGRLLIPVADAMTAFPADPPEKPTIAVVPHKEPPSVLVEPAEAAKLASPEPEQLLALLAQTPDESTELAKVMKALRQLYPAGRDRRTYPTMLEDLQKVRVYTTEATLKRALRELGWIKRRSGRA